MIGWPGLGQVQEYWIDAWQRSILTLDVLRERADIFEQQAEKEVPNVLHFPFEVIRDGRTLPRPVNFGLVRIIPPEDKPTDPTKPPIIVVDPRAGHGPGIGGMKNESEIGIALDEGHACYFVGFSPRPMPGQTIEDVCRAEAAFVHDVAARHPDASGKPIVIGNCQAGWQTMIMASINPDLCGPILLAGSPLSYWAGVRGKNPMRYSGGMLGGTWLTALAGDIGGGLFDGAGLIANFENLNPANTLWKKPYNVYANVDTEAERFLEFETYWGSPVLLNAEEMQWITDNLFVGNKLSTGQIRLTDGTRVDLRNIRSPIIVFCSWGDNITPPQQALGWVLDMYDDVGEIIANGQTIVYNTHQSIGHLGIFVSGKVATKETTEFVSCMEMIDLLPPGLYEAVITPVENTTLNANLVGGKYLFRLEMRTLDDLRAIGGNDTSDEKRFATVARVSEIAHGLYETTAAPIVKSVITPPVAEAIRVMHPNRVRFGIFSDHNPLMQPIKTMAEQVRASRQPVSKDNPLLEIEKTASAWITGFWEAYRDMRDAMTETLFVTTYGWPVLQAAIGLGTDYQPRRAERDVLREAVEKQMELEVEKRLATGTLEDAVIRALIYIRLPDGRVDERGYRVVKQIRASLPDKTLSPAALKQALRDQFLLVHRDQERAIEALPALVGTDPGERQAAVDIINRILAAGGDLSAESKRRLARVEALFGVGKKRRAEAEPTST
jgi:pimeloyl-ACP methyl ester carboxylesterase